MEYQFESLGPTLRIVVLVFMIVFAILLLALVVLAAALPGRIAKARMHPQAQAVNIYLYYTLNHVEPTDDPGDAVIPAAPEVLSDRIGNLKARIDQLAQRRPS